MDVLQQLRQIVQSTCKAALHRLTSIPACSLQQIVQSTCKAALHRLTSATRSCSITLHYSCIMGVCVFAPQQHRLTVPYASRLPSTDQEAACPLPLRH